MWQRLKRMTKEAGVGFVSKVATPLSRFEIVLGLVTAVLAGSLVGVLAGLARSRLVAPVALFVFLVVVAVLWFMARNASRDSAVAIFAFSSPVRAEDRKALDSALGKSGRNWSPFEVVSAVPGQWTGHDDERLTALFRDVVQSTMSRPIGTPRLVLAMRCPEDRAVGLGRQCRRIYPIGVIEVAVRKSSGFSPDGATRDANVEISYKQKFRVGPTEAQAAFVGERRASRESAACTSGQSPVSTSMGVSDGSGRADGPLQRDGQPELTVINVVLEESLPRGTQAEDYIADAERLQRAALLGPAEFRWVRCKQGERKYQDVVGHLVHETRAVVRESLGRRRSVSLALKVGPELAFGLGYLLGEADIGIWRWHPAEKTWEAPKSWDALESGQSS